MKWRNWSPRNVKRRRRQIQEEKRQTQQSLFKRQKEQERLSLLRNLEGLWVRLCIFLSGQDSEALFRREYECLVSDKRISSLDMSIDETSLLITLCTSKIVVPVPNDKHAVFLGIYKIVIRIQGLTLPIPAGFSKEKVKLFLAIRCVESGRKNQIFQVSYPFSNVYGFCFGERRDIIENLLAARELFGLITIVLDSIWHVNDQDFGEFGNTFQRYPLDWENDERYV